MNKATTNNLARAFGKAMLAAGFLTLHNLVKNLRQRLPLTVRGLLSVRD